jgi:CheY-like chemotaxis protein
MTDHSPQPGPASHSASAAAASDPLSPIANGHPRIAGHVLLAEDSPTIRLLVEEFLRRAGATITCAHDGIQAVECVVASLDPASIEPPPIDLILMDIHMPRLNGPEAAAQIRAAGYAGPIVALTAEALTEEEGIEGGFDAVAPKPLNLGAFIPLVARLIAQRAAKQSP